ncbi:chorismate mutase [Streptomyces genisteinicus]|uniref:Chorismate mutase n=1 Tax=Streptomyces genisteinicus TaxID=2768068 RepID=A0A7H0HZH5_9ACTN|nr:chorismate mutase [Streptomyces genisteinicus]QNP65941.1 chorismate mutase [Streptomyces genisteinicus]
MPLDRTLDAQPDITDLRSRIDSIDTEISRLVAERRGHSHRIQRIRLDGGGPRTQLGRENEVIARYTDSLGSAGTALAHLLLTTCRGPLATAPAGTDDGDPEHRA